MAERVAMQRAKLRRIGEGVFAQPIDLLVAAGQEECCDGYRPATGQR